MGDRPPLREDPREAGRRRPSAVHPPRRAALRQRPHPPGHVDEQDPQGFHRQVPVDARPLRAVYPRLGLPRPADRDPRRPPARRQEEGHAGHGRPRGLPQVRREVHRHPAQRVQAPGRPRRLGRALPDHGPGLRGQGPRVPGRLLRARRGLQGQAAGPLVHPRPDRPGRGRDRVQGQDVALDLRPLPGRLGPRGQVPGPGRPQGLGRHLDDHALDPAGQHGHRFPSRIRVRRGRGRRRGLYPGQAPTRRSTTRAASRPRCRATPACRSSRPTPSSPPT